MFRGLSFRGLRSEFSRQLRSHDLTSTSKYKSEGNLFVTYKKAPDQHTVFREFVK